MITLKQFADKLGVHPYDIVGDADEAEILMHEDITDTIFYEEMGDILKDLPDEKAIYKELYS